MLKKVLWIAAAAVAVLVALAVSRMMQPDRAAPTSVTVENAPAVNEIAVPAAAVAPEPPPPVEAKPAPTPEEVQVQEDAAATGMTTMEPQQPKSEDPPT